MISYSTRELTLVRFFCVGAGDYRDSEVVVWCASSYIVLTSAKTDGAINSLRWDPYTVNEFATVGEQGVLCFWLLDETARHSLSVHEADVPEELLKEDGDTVG